MKAAAAEILVKYLEAEGVEFVFGVPGGHLLPLYDAIYRSNIKPILACHEAGAAYMAYGYAVASGKLGVCCGTVGPGATNLITGVASAYVDSVPMLVLTAQVGTTTIGRGALQDGSGVGRTVNQTALFEHFTKLSALAIRGENVPRMLRQALRVAHTGRPGPVHLCLPPDVQAEVVEDELVPVERYRPLVSAGIDATQLKLAASHLQRAKKPALLIGYGAAGSRSQGRELVALAETLGAPVATTLRGKGLFPEDHPLALGCSGLYGTRAANAYLASGIDVLLTLGASFHEFTTNVWDPNLMPSQALVQVDIDPAEIGKNYPATVSLVCDVHAAVRGLLQELGSERRPNPHIEAYKREQEYFAEPVMNDAAMPIKPQHLMKLLRSALPRDTVLFVDIGNSVPWVERYFPIYAEGRFIVASGMAAMGSAIAACIGGKLARPAQPIVCLCGDGAFHMTGMEIATAAAHDIPIVWIILKNNRLGMTYDVQSVSYQNRYAATELPQTDFVGLARSLGAKAYRAEYPSAVESIVREALASRAPTVIEVPIDNDEIPPMKPRMAVMRKPLGLPDVTKSISWDTMRAVWRMAKDR